MPELSGSIPTSHAAGKVWDSDVLLMNQSKFLPVESKRAGKRAFHHVMPS